MAKHSSSAEDILEKAKAEHEECLKEQRQANEAEALFRRIGDCWDRVRYFNVDETRPDEYGLSSTEGEGFWTRWAGHIVALCQELKAQCPPDRLDHLDPGEDPKTYAVEIFKAGWKEDEEAVARLLKAVSTHQGTPAQFQGRVNEWLRRDLVPEIMGWKALDSGKTAEASTPHEQSAAWQGELNDAGASRMDAPETTAGRFETRRELLEYLDNNGEIPLGFDPTFPVDAPHWWERFIWDLYSDMHRLEILWTPAPPYSSRRFTHREAEDEFQRIRARLRAEIGGPPQGAPRDQGEAGQGGGPAKKPKRSTERGEGRAKIIAVLAKHHQHENDSCLNSEPIVASELARIAVVGKGTVNRFFNDAFNDGNKGGYAKYQRACRDPETLAYALKLLLGEVTPSILFKRLSNANELEDTDE